MPLQLAPMPCQRNFDIYYEVVVLGKPQCAVAGTQAISPTRVSQIVHQVSGFVTAFGPGGHMPPALRLLLAQNTYHLLSSDQFDWEPYLHITPVATGGASSVRQPDSAAKQG